MTALSDHPELQASRAPRGTPVFILPICQLAFLAVVAIFVTPSPIHAAWIWIVALVWMGMPHGGLDLHVLTWSKGGPFRPQAWNKFGLYLLMMVMAAALFVIFPLASTMAFLILTGIHFGEADRIFARECLDPNAYLPRAWGIFRGSLVVGLPCALDPGAAWQPFGLLARNTDDPVFINGIQIFGIIFLILALAGAVAMTNVRRISWQSPAVIGFLLETAVVAGWFSILPPLWAIGGYFLAIHATKHMFRLAWLGDPRFGKTGLAGRVLKLHVDSLWLAAPAWLMVAGIALLVPAGPVLAVAAASIGFYLTCTLPHHLLVERLPVS